MANAHILKDLLAELKIKPYRFEKEIGAGASTIDKAIKNDSEITLELIQKIIKRYGNVSREWLLTGNGEMFIKEHKLKEDPAPYKTQDDYHDKYMALLEKNDADKSEIINTIMNVLNRVDSNIIEVKTNLNDVASKQQTFRVTSGANQRIALETLAELRGLDKDTLVNTANNLKIVLLQLDEEKDRSSVSDNLNKQDHHSVT